MDEPIEELRVSYRHVADSSYVVIFTVHGEEMAPVVVPKCDLTSLIACISKMIRVLADPVGPCINEIPC